MAIRVGVVDNLEQALHLEAVIYHLPLTHCRLSSRLAQLA